jgi:hypothetical protein
MPYLVREFARLCGEGWECCYEAVQLSPVLGRLLGYAPRADVVLDWIPLYSSSDISSSAKMSWPS